VASSAEMSSSLVEGVGFRIGRIARVRRAAWAEELAGFAITPPQASVLRAVNDRPVSSLRVLARTLGTDPMTIKRCVDHLEAQGLVRSEVAQGDRRRRVLTLTHDGQVFVRELDARVRAHEQRLRALFSLDEYEEMLRVLARLEAGLGIGDERSAESDE